MTDARFSKQDIDNQGADRLFEGFPMTEIVGYDPTANRLRRVVVGADGAIAGAANQILLDYDSGTNPIYIGVTTAGTATSASTWQIRKLTFDANDNVTSIKYADGVTTFTKEWDDRATYTYS